MRASDRQRLRLCFPSQLAESSPEGVEYVLLVTRETVLDPNAAAHFLDCAARVARYDPTPAVLVGATRCPKTGVLATSGLNRVAGRGRSYRRIEPTLACLPADTFDPNCLLIPAGLLSLFGKGALTPAMGGRLRRQGVNIFLVPNYVGTCPPTSRRRGPRPGFACKPMI